MTMAEGGLHCTVAMGFTGGTDCIKVPAKSEMNVSGLRSRVVGLDFKVYLDSK